MSHFVSSAATRDVNIRTWAAQLLDNATIKTPQEVFREQYLAVQDMVDGEIGLLKGLDQTSDHTASRDRLGKYFGQLRQLEEGHKATVQDKEQTYDREMEERHKQQFVDYIGHLGLSLAGPWMKEIMDAAAAAGEDTPDAKTSSRMQSNRIIMILSQTSASQINPGKINPGKINPGKINPGKINPGKINPGPINPSQINPSQINLS
ncbi:hypothetical protein ACJ41O_000249 [Fusarium nematophilum]